MSLFQGKVYLRARELKRVPKDFDWPLGQVWRGYLTRKKIEPPLGEGYQLWETTTKGSPKSPVFDTLEELCEWCETNAAPYAERRMTAEQWKELLTNPKARFWRYRGKHMGNDYSNAITIAAEVADLVHSEFWGTNEGTTIEDVEHTKAITAYAVQTGYMLHEVKETLLQVVHLEASDYDSEPEIHKEQALNCLQAIQGYEASHNDHFRSLDVTTQIMEWVYKEETRDLYKPNRYWDVYHAILTGCQYEDLVKRPFWLHKWDTPYDKAVLSDIHNRLKYFEDKHRVSSAS